MNHRVNLIASIVGTLLTLQAATALAQPSAQDRARQALAEAQAHEDAQRHALAAQRFLELYDLMREAQLPRAPIALWSAGFNLRQVPGRELEALETLRRFLDTSTTLSADVEIQGFRSDSVSLIAELEARAPQSSGQDLGEPDGAASSAPASVARDGGGTISPVGPVILGVGGITLLAGVVVGALSLGMNSDINAECPGAVCPPALEPQYDEMRAFSVAADGLLVAGGIVAALGLVLTLTLTEGDSTEVSASCGPDGCRAVARGSF